MNPKKRQSYSSRAATVGLKPSFADLNEQLNNFKKREFALSYTAYRAMTAKEGDSLVVKSKVWSTFHGGNSCAGLRMHLSNNYHSCDSGMKAEIFPLTKELDLWKLPVKNWR